MRNLFDTNLYPKPQPGATAVSYAELKNLEPTFRVFYLVLVSISNAKNHQHALDIINSCPIIENTHKRCLINYLATNPDRKITVTELLDYASKVKTEDNSRRHNHEPKEKSITSLSYSLCFLIAMLASFLLTFLPSTVRIPSL